MKGCLKHCSASATQSPMPSPGLPPAPPCTPTTSAGLCAQRRKCVAWSMAALEEVHIADDWDRTPTEPSKHLSYRDMLELKEIQRSLPIANQPFDPFTHKPTAQYLTTVPINLLPLLPETSPSPSPTCAGSATSSSSPSPASSLPHSPALLPSPLPADGSSPLRGPGSVSTPQLPSEQHFAVRPGRLFPRGISSRSTSPSPANSRSNSRSSSPNRNTLAVPQAKPPMCILPLADASTPTSSSPSSPLLSPTSVAIPKPPPSLPTHLSHLSHLLPNKSQSRNAPKRAFNFLPLLDTPPTSAAATPMNSTFTTPSPSISTSKAGSVVSSALSSPLPSPSTVIKALEACALNCDDEDDVAYASEASSDVGSSVRSYDPPTPSLTNASLDSSPPMSRASSMSPEFALRQLGGHHEVPTPAEKEDQGYFPHPSAYVPPPSSNSAYSHFGEETIVPSALPPTTRAMRLSALPSPALIPPSPLNLSLLPNFPLASALGNFDEAQPRSPTLLATAQPIVRETPSTTPEPKKKQKKPKQVIVINDEEIEIGGDSENEEEEVDSSGSEASNSTSSASVSGGLSVGGFVGVGVGNSRFSRSMGERMMWSSSYVMAFEDDDSLSRSPTSQDVGFVGVSSMLGMEVSTESSTLLSSVTVTSTSTLPTPSLPSPELTPTPTPPPKSRPALLTPTSSPPPSLRSLPGPSGLASTLQDDQCEHLVRTRSRTPTLDSESSSTSNYGQQATPPPSEPGSPTFSTMSLPTLSSPVAIPGRYQDGITSPSTSPVRGRRCSSPVGTRSGKVSMSPRVSCSPKVSTSPKCATGSSNAVARKRASMSPRSSPVLA